MRTAIALLVIAGSLGLASWAGEETADSKAIKESVLNYLEGWFTSDPDRMSKALHPNLSKITVKTLPETSTEFLDRMSAETLVAYTKHNQKWVQDKKTHTMKIVYQDDRIAVVHAVSDDFYDVCGLVKLNGEWKIVHVLWDKNEAEK